MVGRRETPLPGAGAAMLYLEAVKTGVTTGVPATTATEASLTSVSAGVNPLGARALAG